MKTPDPRVMLLIVACLSTLGVLIETTWFLAAVLVITVLLSILMGANMILVVKRIKGLLFVIISITLLESIFNRQGEVLISIGGFHFITHGGLLRGANTLLRVSTVIASASIFTLTTSRCMIQGLIQMKVPYEFTFMASVAMRFLPVFSEEFRDSITAIQLRGVDLKKIPLRQKIRIYGYILTPVAFGAVDKAQKLAYAMELRAFRAYPKRTSRFILRLKAFDYVYMVFFVLLTAGALIYNYVFL